MLGDNTNFHSRIVSPIPVGGISYPKSIAVTLIHNRIRFICYHVGGYVEFTVSHNDSRSLDMTIRHLESVNGHEILHTEGRQ